MDKNIQNFIDTKKQELEKLRASKKRDFLIQQGLYEKVYAPDHHNVDTNEYPYYDRNEEDGTPLYYKAVAINLTDKEYEEVYAAYKAVENELEDENDEEENNSKNNMSVFMIVASVIIYIAGFVGGIIAGNNFDRYGFTLWLAIAIWVPTFVYGSLLLGLSEVIKLLHCQRD